MNKPRRWTAKEIAEMHGKLGGFVPNAEFIQAPEFDRVVAELKIDSERLSLIVMELDDKYWGEFNRHQQTRAEIERLKGEE